MNCIIVDDEPASRLVLEEYIKSIPFITITGNCTDAYEAFELLRTTKVDLIFLDILLPKVSGIDFIKALELKPLFIFTTGSLNYAIEAYNINAVDYLVKPFPFERLLKSVNKAYELFNFRIEKKVHHLEMPEPRKNEGFILVKSEYQTQRVDLHDITYIEGLKDYIKIFLITGKPIVTLNSLKNMAERLPSGMFLRVHKSYIVSLNKINSIVRNRIIIGDKWIPIGEIHKSAFFETIQKHDLKL
jgi:DNA-binding LytR/AlgR family response regulator